MHARALAYWSTTALLSLAMLGSAAGKLARAEPIVETMTHLGIPLSITTILGAWIALGAVALLAPGFARVKEWAYAGVTFWLTGAVAVHVLAGDGLGSSAPLLVLMALAVASYGLRPADRRLAPAPAAAAPAPGRPVAPRAAA